MVYSIEDNALVLKWCSIYMQLQSKMNEKKDRVKLSVKQNNSRNKACANHRSGTIRLCFLLLTRLLFNYDSNPCLIQRDFFKEDK